MPNLNHDDRLLNFAFLQAVADSVGRELEERAYDELVEPVEPLSFSRNVDGVEVRISAATKRRDHDGLLSVSVDVSADLPTPFGARPSYVFMKRRDGAVVYQPA